MQPPTLQCGCSRYPQPHTCEGSCVQGVDQVQGGQGGNVLCINGTQRQACAAQAEGGEEVEEGDREGRTGSV